MVFPLLIGMGMLLVSLLCYSMATTLIVHLVEYLIRMGYAGLSFWKSVSVMMIVSLITALVHLMLIALWALAIRICGEASSFENAFYFSAQNYTALGYGDFILSERWRLLGPLEAINGLLFFGLSTAVMFTVLSRLITIRLHLQAGHVGQDNVSAAPASARRNENAIPRRTESGS